MATHTTIERPVVREVREDAERGDCVIEELDDGTRICDSLHGLIVWHQDALERLRRLEGSRGPLSAHTAGTLPLLARDLRAGQRFWSRYGCHIAAGDALWRLATEVEVPIGHSRSLILESDEEVRVEVPDCEGASMPVLDEEGVEVAVLNVQRGGGR